MAKKNKPLDMLLNISSALVWIAVGMAMTNGILAVPFIGTLINQIIGWVVVASGVLGTLRAVGLMK